MRSKTIIAYNAINTLFLKRPKYLKATNIKAEMKITSHKKKFIYKAILDKTASVDNA